MFLFWRRSKAQNDAADRFGGYQIVKMIHEGRKSTVYQARLDNGEPTALIKSYNPKFDRDARKMWHKHQLRWEGPVGKILNAPAGVDPATHPICQTLDFGNEFGKAENPHYVVLECIRGHNLKNLITTAPDAVRKHAIEVWLQIMVGLAFMHDRALLHRDFCSDNVMIGTGWRAKIIDFGFVCPVGRSFEQRSGTPTYMAPEQFTADPLTPAADIYSMGVVAYEMLASRPPFLTPFSHNDPDVQDKRTMALMEMHLRQPPPALRQFNPDVPAAVEAVLMKCLAKSPADRYESIMEARRALIKAIESK